VQGIIYSHYYIIVGDGILIIYNIVCFNIVYAVGIIDNMIADRLLVKSIFGCVRCSLLNCLFVLRSMKTVACHSCGHVLLIAIVITMY